jgi:hypothetical protein
MRRSFLAAMLVSLATLSTASTPALARVKLITLPVRQRVEIQLDHPQATLVEEERIVPLVEGINQVDFSWANTQIDPNTILFRVLPGPVGEGKPLEVNVLSVSYPPNENSLVWQVSSSGSGSARVRISYLLANLTKSFNYRAVATNDESTLVLSQYIRLRNFANEEFGSTGLWAGFGTHFLKAVGINETKQMLMEKYQKVPIKKTYTADLQLFGYLDRPKNKLTIPMHYVLKNSKSHNLGKAPLQFGKVRIFQDDGRGSTAFIGEDWGKFTPLDDEMKLYVGTAQDVVVVRTIEKNEQKRVAGNLFNREVIIKYEIENFKDRAITLDVAESIRAIRNEVSRDTGRDVEWVMGKETTFKGGKDKERSTFDKVVLHTDLPARGADGKAKKIILKLHVIIKNEW